MKQKKCLGTGKAKGYGCGKQTEFRKYGLCNNCYRHFLYETPEGSEIIKKFTIKAKKELKPKRKYIKWIDKPFNEMVKYVQFEICNKYIRWRDNSKYGRCISSGLSIVDAGHYFPTTISQLRFCCQNIHGQNWSDNRFKSGNLQAFKDGLILRYGQKYFDTLERLKIDCRNWPKLDRIELIRIGKTYEYLLKKEIHCFTHDEFENYKDLINK